MNQCKATDSWNSLLYSCCNEDSRSELRALRPKGRRVLSIAASGGRAFSLLLEEPKEVVAIDTNYHQIHLCRLKYHTMRMLDRNRYLAFAGIGPSNSRLKVYERIRGELADETREFWDSRRQIVEKGIIYAGEFDRNVILLSKMFRLFAGWDIRRLNSCATVEEQIRYISPFWRDRLWTVLARCVFNSWLSKVMLVDAGVGGEHRIASSYFYQNFRTYLERHLFRESFLMQYFARGRLTEDGPLPLHLEKDNYETVRQRLDRLSFQRCDILSYLGNGSPAKFDAFSLSDVGSYLGREEMETLLSRIESVSTDGTLICLREYLASLDTGIRWPGSLKRDVELERELARTDKSLGYTFVCARVQR